MKRINGSEKNPELLLIDKIAEQIQDDERLIDGLGDGDLGLEDVEQWYQRRQTSAQRFLEECGALIDSMRSNGFGRILHHRQRRQHRRGAGQAVW